MHTRRSIILILSSIFSGSILLIGCEQNNKPEVQYGSMSATGTIVETPVSLTRRGTHLFLQEDGTSLFIESKVQNLQEFEGHLVKASGELKPNTSSKDHPVLLAHEVKNVDNASEMHQWDIPSLQIKIQTPVSWNGTIEHGIARFTLPEEEEPMTSITVLSGTTLPAGTPFYVHNRRAVRIGDANDGEEEVYILDGTRILSIHFLSIRQKNILSLEQQTLLASAFHRVIASVEFHADSQKKDGGTVQAELGPICGGIAGILCPTGSYCDIADAVSQSGVCKKK